MRPSRSILAPKIRQRLQLAGLVVNDRNLVSDAGAAFSYPHAAALDTVVPIALDSNAGRRSQVYAITHAHEQSLEHYHPFSALNHIDRPALVRRESPIFPHQRSISGRSPSSPNRRQKREPHGRYHLVHRAVLVQCDGSIVAALLRPSRSVEGLLRMKPGATLLTVMFHGPSSCASCRVSPICPALALA
jgi:hypothetical protein